MPVLAAVCQPRRVNNASILLVTVIGHEPSGYAMQSSYQVNLTR